VTPALVPCHGIVLPRHVMCAACMHVSPRMGKRACRPSSPAPIVSCTLDIHCSLPKLAFIRTTGNQQLHQMGAGILLMLGLNQFWLTGCKWVAAI
jgi:hypothetical protein